MTLRGHLGRPKLWQSVVVLAGALALVGAGTGIGLLLRGGAGAAATGGKDTGSTNAPGPAKPASGTTHALGSGHALGADAIDMSGATGVECRPPAAPGPAHPKRVLAQLFSVHDGRHTAYLLGWQIVPYRGPGTYQFATGGNLLALEPPAGGLPVGFGKGSVTFFGGSDSGTVHAVVALKSGATVKVGGTWICAAAGG